MNPYFCARCGAEVDAADAMLLGPDIVYPDGPVKERTSLCIGCFADVRKFIQTNAAVGNTRYGLDPENPCGVVELKKPALGRDEKELSETLTWDFIIDPRDRWIIAGSGYRLLAPGEQIQSGDECCSDGSGNWLPVTCSIGSTVGGWNAEYLGMLSVRRKID